MTGTVSLLDRICEAQTRNTTLAGDDLRAAAHGLAALAMGSRMRLLAVDEAGERLIGAALVQDHGVQTVDTSRRLDDLHILLVAGWVAGTTGIAMKAELARSLGAQRVEVVTLGSVESPIAGCERVLQITSRRHLLAL